MFEVERPDDQPADEEPQPSAGGNNEKGSSADRQPVQKGGSRRKVIALGTALAAIAVGAGAYALSQQGSSPGSTAAAPAAPQQASGPLRLDSVDPSNGEQQVQGAAPIVVSFSSPVADNTPDPTITPAVPGSWAAEGDALVFTPAVAFQPQSRISVRVPSGPDGVRGANGGLLTQGMSEQFTTADYSGVRLAQLLAQLGYLPMTWSASGSGTEREQSVGGDSASSSQAGLAYDPPAGTFSWDAGYPSTLQQQWSADGQNVVVRGAVMAFESEHGLPITGDTNARFWADLFSAAALGQQNPNGYTYAVANKGSPETLTIWHNGHEVLRSLANTGIPASPTVDGTFPVFERFRFQIMRGTNPDGSSYADPVSFVSYFNGGDAVHYFPRGGYGYQQSLGCVELPYTEAQNAWPYLTYGSLVSVTG